MSDQAEWDDARWIQWAEDVTAHRLSTAGQARRKIEQTVGEYVRFALDTGRLRDEAVAAERERVLAEFETLADKLEAAARGGFSTSAPHIRALVARLRGPS